MVKFLGFLLIFLSCYNFEQGIFTVRDILIFLLGLGLVCSKAIFIYFLLVQREKARTHSYRHQKRGQ